MILTNPGERAFLPEFGGGIRRLIFENIQDTTAAVAKAMITQAIHDWLGHRITVESLSVTAENETIEVEIQYRVAGTDQIKILRFRRSGG